MADADPRPSESLRGLWLCLDLAVRTPLELRARARAVLETLSAGSVGALWLRAPRETTVRTLVTLATELCAHARAHGVPVLIGDRVDVAIVSGADGVHLGSQSVSPSEARALFSRAKRGAIVSAAAHDRAEIDARQGDCDALVVSPVFEVPGKGAALGLGGFAALRAGAPARAFVALGGVDQAERVVALRNAGAAAVAVRRAVLAPASVTEAVAACERLASAMRGAA